MQSRWWQAAVVALCLAVVGGGGAVIVYDSLVAPAAPPAARPTRAKAGAPTVQRAAKAARPHAEAQRKGTARLARKAVPKHAPAQRAAIRVDSRDQAIDAILDRVEQHANAASWDDDTLQSVEEEMVSSAEATSSTLAQVDRGEARWDDVRAQVRQGRLDSAARVERILGKSRFDAMVADVGLQRFMGDQPVRGRLDSRVAGGGRTLGQQ
jgi:hypothetical protein